MKKGTSVRKAERLRRLHGEGAILVLANAWDPMSARVFEDCGFPAIATTSAGISYSRGRSDGESLTRDEMLTETGHIADAVSIPITADVESGYGETAEEVARTAFGVIESGAVGLNIEDASDVAPPSGEDTDSLVEMEEQLERIAAVVEAGRSAGVPLVVNARTDIYWREVGDADERFHETVRRANAFLGVGADCVFVPGVRDAETISALVREIDGPLNVLAGSRSPSVSELEEIGVRRVTVGSGPARAVMGRVREIGDELLDAGTYESLARGAIPYPEANALFE